LIQTVLRRVLSSSIVLVGIIGVLFTLIHLPATDLAPLAPGMSPEDRQRVRSEYRQAFGLDRPIIDRFAHWSGNLLSGDLGFSQADGRPVTTKLKSALGPTLLLQGSAILLMFAIGIPLGVLCAAKRGRWLDRIVFTILTASWSVPGFWLGTLLLLYLCTDAGFAIFPPGGWPGPEEATFGNYLKHMILPVLVLALPGICVITRHVRASMSEALESDYVRFARSLGIDEGVILRRHALRNSLLPVVTIFGGILPSLIGGSIIVERIFDIQGMGHLLWESAAARDHTVLQAVFFFSVIATLAGYLMSDIAGLILNPRTRTV
jgi:peptide/nickel transport system permease protein